MGRDRGWPRACVTQRWFAAAEVVRFRRACRASQGLSWRLRLERVPTQVGEAEKVRQRRITGKSSGGRTKESRSPTARGMPVRRFRSRRLRLCTFSLRAEAVRRFWRSRHPRALGSSGGDLVTPRRVSLAGTMEAVRLNDCIESYFVIPDARSGDPESRAASASGSGFRVRGFAAPRNDKVKTKWPGQARPSSISLCAGRVTPSRRPSRLFPKESSAVRRPETFRARCLRRRRTPPSRTAAGWSANWRSP